MTKVLLVANTDWYLYNFRLSLARELRRRGVDVVLVAPMGSYAARLEAEGFRRIELRFSRRGANPFAELCSVARWIELYRREKPDLVHHFTLKPVLYGSIAARCTQIGAVVNSITGLGYLFTSHDLSATLLRWLALPLYRFALGLHREMVIFQNKGDMETIRRLGLVRPGTSVVIPGSGVDVERFAPGPDPPEPLVILMAARMLWDKGVGDLVDAARLLSESAAGVRIVLVGDPDPGNPSSIPVEQLTRWHADGVIEWWGRHEDMPGVYARCHIVVLPSHGEGFPRGLAEAAAMGKPLVATDLQGCREIVYNGDNGFLVPPRNPSALAEALMKLVLDAPLRERMGRRSRELILGRFTEEVVNQQTLAVYDSLLGKA